MKVCPRCTLYNPDIAERCDCGFSFGNASPQDLDAEFVKSYIVEKRKAVRGTLVGAAAVLVFRS